MATVIEGIKFYTIPETAKTLRVTPHDVTGKGGNKDLGNRMLNGCEVSIFWVQNSNIDYGGKDETKDLLNGCAISIFCTQLRSIRGKKISWLN